MPHVTSVERWAVERGREEGREEGRAGGLQDGLAVGLELKFGARGKRLLSRICRITDTATLESLLRALKTASTPDEFRQALP